MGVRENLPLSTSEKGPNFKIKGRILRLKNPIEIYAGFSRQDLILGVARTPFLGEDINPQQLLFEFQNEDMLILPGLKVGQDVEVHFILVGRTSDKTGITKHFVALQRFEVVQLDKLGEPIMKDYELFDHSLRTPRTIGLGGRLGQKPPEEHREDAPDKNVSYLLSL